MHRHQELNNSLFNVSSIRPHSLQPISHAELLTSLESATASALEMQELQAQVFQLQQRLAERTAQSTELSTLKQTLTREVAQLRTEVARVPLLQREIDELKDQLARSEAVRATQRQYIMTLDRKVNFLQEENLRSSTQLARLAITAPTEQHEVASEPAKAKTKTASVSTASATTETHVRPHSAVSPSKAASKTKPAPSSILKGTIASSSKVRAASPDRPVRRLSTSASAASLKGSKETWRPW
jgi:chromosome segregation ATPase